MRTSDGEVLCEAFHFPLGRRLALHDAEILAAIHAEDGDGWLELTTDVFAQSVTIDCPGYRPAENGFHLAPGRPKAIKMIALCRIPDKPAGSLRSLGSKRSTAF